MMKRLGWLAIGLNLGALTVLGSISWSWIAFGWWALGIACGALAVVKAR